MHPRRAIAASLLIVSLTVSGCATSGGRIPNRSMGGGSGELHAVFYGSHPEFGPAAVPQGAMPPCANEPKTGITEISIEHTSCYGYCPTYTLRFYVDGSVTYRGQANVKFVGSRTGRLQPGLFEQLAALALDIGYFGLEDNYECNVTDLSVVYVSLVRDGSRKTIRHYAPGLTGPPRLRAFETLIDQMEHNVTWTRRK
jgi:hypothetical protein